MCFGATPFRNSIEAVLFRPIRKVVKIDQPNGLPFLKRFLKSQFEANRIRKRSRGCRHAQPASCFERRALDSHAPVVRMIADEARPKQAVGTNRLILATGWALPLSWEIPTPLASGRNRFPCGFVPPPINYVIPVVKAHSNVSCSTCRGYQEHHPVSRHDCRGSLQLQYHG